MPSFRFIHAADIHLDSPLQGLAGHEGAAVERIRSATREALEALIGRAVAEEAAFLVIAGDLYDGDWKDYQTGLFFIQQMGRLREAGIPAFLIYGNHDAESQITSRLTLPDNVRTFSARRPETMRLDGLGVALHGQSFSQRDVTENLARRYPEPVAGHFNVGILHTGLSGEEGHANYAPCTLAELVQKGYDYWALGHIHQPGIRHERPYVAYSGNLQGRHIRETGPRGALLVTVEDGEVAALDPFSVDVVRWEAVAVSAAGCDRLQDVVEKIRQGVQDAVSSRSDGRLLACRIGLAGRTRLHNQVLAAQEWLLAEARAAAVSLGEAKAWIERLVVLTESGSGSAPEANLQDALGALREARDDEALVSQLRGELGRFVGLLPPEIREGAEDPLLRAVAEGDYASLIERATPHAAARLLGDKP